MATSLNKLFFVSILTLATVFARAQNRPEAEKLVNEGVACHDRQHYDSAIAKYDKALELDKDNLLALSEKALTLFSIQHYDESVSYCKKAVETHAGDKYLNTVYVTYGNALDALKQTDNAITVYDEGIKLFPEYYQLYFNKGISLSFVGKNKEAINCFEKAVMCNPNHASSHNAIARLSIVDKQRVPSLLAFCRFLAVEPEGSRAKDNLLAAENILAGSTKQTGDKNVTIQVDPSQLDAINNGSSKENNFASTDLILQMNAALDYDDKNKKKTKVEQFIRKFETICSSLKETKKDNYGFFWDYYVPYFSEMEEKHFLNTFSYIAFASSDEPDVADWLKAHPKDIEAFFNWSKSFKWKTN